MAKQHQRRPNPHAKQSAPQQRKAAPVRRTEKKESIFSSGSRDFIFGRKNFIYMGIGLGLILLGLATMAGGSMPDPNKWEPERIYSFRRITLAPLLMVAGFITVILGIFKKSDAPAASPESGDASPSE
ncbi:MAG: DUF3098 domain-containing protein [Saprospiraceae bacterium]|nr:DUF3098 domain-containing protein [Saprospiraceae bacterium]MCB0574662.1 DUF3098 domain-containing protein [Saprospiraceae bacterium]MCB9305191.1 DUF3098 domain-containing protein [Lewinellaceae bacterium]MCB9355546.1 DUF3098 domain-containing protein [Lewinellaceae bacterium]